MFNAEIHRKRYEVWLASLTPGERTAHEAGVAAAEERFNIDRDIRFQYDGKRKKQMPCSACGISVTHCGVFPFGSVGEIRWYVSEDHVAPCGRICLLSSEASHFGGKIMRPFADSPDCHRGHFCECQTASEAKPKNRIRIPVHPSKRRPTGG